MVHDKATKTTIKPIDRVHVRHCGDPSYRGRPARQLPSANHLGALAGGTPAVHLRTCIPLDHPSRRRIPVLLRRAWYGLNQACRRRLAHTGFTPDQFTILRYLNECNPKGVTQRELADLMSSDPNTMSSIIRRMESLKLISREPHESDGRAERIKMNPLGSRAYKKLRPIALELQAWMLSAIPEEKQEEFLLHLENLSHACRKAAEHKK